MALTLTDAQKNNVLNYLKSAFWDNSSNICHMDYVGHVWKLGDGTFKNFYNPTTNTFSYDKVINSYDSRNFQNNTNKNILFGGWKIGWQNKDDIGVLSHTSCDINVVTGYGTSCSGVKPDIKGTPNNYYTAEHVAVFDKYKSSRIFPNQIGGSGSSGTPPNAIPGYYRVSRNDAKVTGGLTDLYTDNGFLAFDGGQGYPDYAHILFIKLRDKTAFANDILTNHPKLVTAVFNLIYKVNDIATLTATPMSDSRLTASKAIVTTLRSLEPTTIVTNMKTLTTIGSDNSTLNKKTNICLMFPDSCKSEAINYIKADPTFDAVSNRWCDLATTTAKTGYNNVNIAFLSDPTDIKKVCSDSYSKLKCVNPANRYKSGFTNKNGVPPSNLFRERFSHLGGNQIGFRDQPVVEGYSGINSCPDVCQSALPGTVLYEACKQGSINYCSQQPNNIVSSTCITDSHAYPELATMLTQWCKTNTNNPNYATYCTGSNYVAPVPPGSNYVAPVPPGSNYVAPVPPTTTILTAHIAPITPTAPATPTAPIAPTIGTTLAPAEPVDNASFSMSTSANGTNVTTNVANSTANSTADINVTAPGADVTVTRGDDDTVVTNVNVNTADPDSVDEHSGMSTLMIIIIVISALATLLILAFGIRYFVKKSRKHTRARTTVYKNPKEDIISSMNIPVSIHPRHKTAQIMTNDNNTSFNDNTSQIMSNNDIGFNDIGFNDIPM